MSKNVLKHVNNRLSMFFYISHELEHDERSCQQGTPSKGFNIIPDATCTRATHRSIKNTQGNGIHALFRYIQV